MCNESKSDGRGGGALIYGPKSNKADEAGELLQRGNFEKKNEDQSPKRHQSRRRRDLPPFDICLLLPSPRFAPLFVCQAERK